MGDAEDGTPRFVGQAFNLPAMREDNLLDYGQAEAGTASLGREIGLEDLGAAVGGNAGAVVTQIKAGFVGIALFRYDLDFPVAVDGLDGVD